MSREDLLQEIEAYLEATGLSASKLGRDAMGDPAFVLKIRNGRNVRLDTAVKIRQYMLANPPPKRRSKRAANPSVECVA